MIWFLFLILVFAGLLILFLKLGAGAGVSVDPVAHYRAQLAEIEMDEEQGAIDADGARAARLELQRRLLKAGNATGSEPSPDNASSLSTQVIGSFAVVILVVAAGVYALLGNPGVPAAQPSPVEQASNRLVEDTGVTMGQALEQVKGHLDVNPEDVQGWKVLAQTARAVGDFAAAAQAYGELARMEAGDANWRANELEAYIAHAGGQITPAARLVLAALISEAPDHPAGQYYLGLVRLQSGDEAGARAVWTALADRSSPQAPWMPRLRQQLGSLGVNPPALSEQDMAVVDAMSEEEREAFMLQMLERLESRLESNPVDPEGWLMLARSKLALGDKTGAIKALESGISANPGANSSQLQAFLDNLLENPDL